VRAGRLRAGWDGHLLLLTEGSSDWWAALAAWTTNGLEQGEKILCAEPASGRETLLDALQTQGVDARLAVADGHLDLLPAWRFAVDGLPDLAVRNALDEGYGGVRIAPPHVPGRERVAVERVLERLCRSHPVGALCGYDRGTARGNRLVDAVGAHPDGIRTTMLVTRATPAGGLAVAGEVDISNLDLFAAAVERAIERTTGPVLWLDLSDLRFMDVAGCRALVHATRHFRNDGGGLLLVDPLPPVAHVLALLGVDALTGVNLMNR
jgi:anti-anti-sigma factor